MRCCNRQQWYQQGFGTTDLAMSETHRGGRLTSRRIVRIFTLGYKDKYSKIGTPPKPSHVWLPTGLFPTCLASGNSGLVRTIFLRAMCPLYSRFSVWFDATHSKAARSREEEKLAYDQSDSASQETAEGQD